MLKDENKISQDFAVRLEALDKLLTGKNLLPPWLFRHEDLLKSLGCADHIKLKNIINTINHIHFNGKSVFILLRHLLYQNTILLKAIPQPCRDNHVMLHWIDDKPAALNLSSYEFHYLIIEDGRAIIFVPAKLRSINDAGLEIELMDAAESIRTRKARRHICTGIKAKLNQSGFTSDGTLLDFNNHAFRIKMNSEDSCPYSWFNLEEDIVISLSENETSLLSVSCRVIRQSQEREHREIVAAPINKPLFRFKKKTFRNPRRELIPPPTISFLHPFTRKRIVRDICDISNLGFSVFEDEDDAVLLTGLIIPELVIIFNGMSQIRCVGQVVYCQRDDRKGLVCGIAILDMSIKDYSQLTHIISNLLDSKTHLSQEVDIDDLCKFFFETDFIYPEKYKYVAQHKDDFAKTYKKLYGDRPEISRHFTYERNGRIFAHISMIKAYTRTWAVHHHAANTIDGRLTAFKVLKQIIQFFNGIGRLPAAKTDFALCYYRPDNEFPDHVFGDFTRDFGITGSSLDLFSYLNFRKKKPVELPNGWLLSKCEPLNIWELEQFYNHRSGGLFLDAVGIKNNNMIDDELRNQYLMLGLERECRAYSLTWNKQLHAIIIVEISTPVLNLSGLTNCIKVIVTQPELLPWDILSRAIAYYAEKYDQEEVPVLFYPSEYPRHQHLKCDKEYLLWVLNLRDHENDYGEFLERKFRVRLK